MAVVDEASSKKISRPPHESARLFLQTHPPWYNAAFREAAAPAAEEKTVKLLVDVADDFSAASFVDRSSSSTWPGRRGFSAGDGLDIGEALIRKTLLGRRDDFSAPRAGSLFSLVAGPHGVIGLDSPDLADAPTIARFGQRDPAESEDRSYGYASNNPARRTDPYGLQDQETLLDQDAQNEHERLVLEKMKDVPGTEQWYEQIYARASKRAWLIVRSTPPIFKGFEAARYQQHDDIIKQAVIDFNANKTKYCGCTDQQSYRIPDITAAFVKAWIIQESGGGDRGSLAAWAVDPAQVNVPGDWDSSKESLGLKKPATRNTGTAELNIKAAIGYLSRKGFGSSGRPPREKGVFDGWRRALERYGPPDPSYSQRILRRVADRNIYRKIEKDK